MAKEEQGLLSKAGSFLYDSFIWDDDASLGSNIFWSGVTAASIGGALFTGGLSLGGLALRGGAKAAISTAAKTAAKTTAKEVSKATTTNLTKTFKSTAGDINKIAGTALAKTKGYLSGHYSRGTTMAVSAAPTIIVGGAFLTEHETGGALSRAALNTAIQGIKSGIENGSITAENLNDQINRISYIMDVSNALNKTAQNLVVQQAIGGAETPSAEDIKRGKIAAVAWQTTNAGSLIAKNVARMAIVDDLFEDKDQANKYLAEQFIDDIIKGAKVNALEGHQITKSGVKNAVNRALKTTAGQALITGRLKDGLQQVWPDLDNTPTSSFNNRAGQNIDTGNGVQNTLMNLPFIAPIVKFFKWVNDFVNKYITPLFSGADNSNLDVQGGHRNRLAKLMDKNGHNPAAGATIALKSHNGEELGNRTLDVNNPQTGLNLAPAVQ